MTDGDDGWETLFWTLFEQSRNPVALLDEQLQFVALNDPGLRMLGRSRGYLIGRSWLDYVDHDELPEVMERWRSLRADVPRMSGQRTILTRDERRIPIEYVAHIVTVSGRRLVIWIVTELTGSAAVRLPDHADPTSLTPREREVIDLISRGEETAGIAGAMAISQETARTHVRNAMRKLGVHTRAQLVAVSLSAGLVSPPQ